MDACSIRLPLDTGSRTNDPVMSRLRKMREKREIRDDQAIATLMDRVKASGRANRMDWFKGQMRWFVGSTHAAKIKANIEVEKSLGREQPDLWVVSKEAAKDARFSVKESREYAKLVNTGSHPVMPDPLADAEKEFLASMAGLPPGGKVEAMPKQIESTQESEVLRIEMTKDTTPEAGEQTAVVRKEKTVEMRRLRLMQIHQGKRNIEIVAEEVIADIQLICMDREASKSEHHVEKWNAGLHLVEEKGEQPSKPSTSKPSAFQNLSSAVSAVQTESKDADDDFVPPSPDSAAIWG